MHSKYKIDNNGELYIYNFIFWMHFKVPKFLYNIFKNSKNL